MITTAPSATDIMRETAIRFQVTCCLSALVLIGFTNTLIGQGRIETGAGWLIMTMTGLTGIAAALMIYRRASHYYDQLHTHEAAISLLADFASDLYWETDIEGKVVEARGRLMTSIVPEPQELVGLHFMQILKLDEPEMQKMMLALNRLEPYSDILSSISDPDGKIYHISLSGTPRFDHAGEVNGYIGVGTNVTERMAAQTQLQHMAEHDMLTGLANRYAFQSQIEDDLLACADRKNVAILAIDLDDFKAVNDTYGHQAGDALLNLVAKRLRQVVRNGDWAARLGGDEFVVVCRNVVEPIDAGLVAARLQLALSKPYRIGGLELESKASIGVACAPRDATTAEQLLKCADLALYSAKADGRGCYRFYHELELSKAS